MNDAHLAQATHNPSPKHMRSPCLLLLVIPGLHCSHPPHVGAEASGPVAHVASDPSLVEICDRTWMTRNLDVAAYRNGDPIPHVQDATTWVNLRTGAWCWYDNDSAAYAATYGRLYNWYAVNDPRGLAPTGWHVLNAAEWAAVEACAGNDSAGYSMREAGRAHWPGPATAADNSSGFAGLPSGMRSDSGAFSQVGLSAVFWTSEEGSESEAWCCRLIHYVNNKGVPAMVTGVGYMSKSDGYAVRCVRDP